MCCPPRTKHPFPHILPLAEREQKGSRKPPTVMCLCEQQQWETTVFNNFSHHLSINPFPVLIVYHWVCILHTLPYRAMPLQVGLSFCHSLLCIFGLQQMEWKSKIKHESTNCWATVFLCYVIMGKHFTFSNYSSLLPIFATTNCMFLCGPLRLITKSFKFIHNLIKIFQTQQYSK